MTKRFILLAFLGLTVSGLANADGPDYIEIRQAGQDLLAGDFDGIRAVAEAKGDVGSLETPAKAMARWIRQFPAQFPPGTEQGHDTKALPAVWSDAAGFRKAADTMADASETLAQLAQAGDVEGATKQVKIIGADCRDCHRAYRAR